MRLLRMRDSSRDTYIRSLQSTAPTALRRHARCGNVALRAHCLPDSRCGRSMWHLPQHDPPADYIDDQVSRVIWDTIWEKWQFSKSPQYCVLSSKILLTANSHRYPHFRTLRSTANILIGCCALFDIIHQVHICAILSCRFKDLISAGLLYSVSDSLLRLLHWQLHLQLHDSESLFGSISKLMVSDFSCVKVAVFRLGNVG